MVLKVINFYFLNKVKMAKTKYSWTIAEQIGFSKVIKANDQNRLCDYLLINGTSKDVQILYTAYSKNQILGLIFNFIKRNLNLTNIDIIFTKLIQLEPRLVCLYVAMICCQQLLTFTVLIDYGYVPDKIFLQAFINMVLDSFNDSNDNIVTSVNNQYIKVTNYLIIHNYFTKDQFSNIFSTINYCY